MQQWNAWNRSPNKRNDLCANQHYKSVKFHKPQFNFIMKPWPFLMFLALLFTLPALGQENVVHGLVVETGSETPVRGAVVTIRNAKNIILYNTQTSAKGEFSLMVRREKVAGATLVVSSMTHQTTQCPLTNQAFYRVEMQPKAFEIKDVYVNNTPQRHHKLSGISLRHTKRPHHRRRVAQLAGYKRKQRGDGFVQRKGDRPVSD